MKASINYFVLLIAGLISFHSGSGQAGPGSKQVQEATRHLKKAAGFNFISLGFGVASNIEMAAIGGFPLEYDDGLNPAANVSHMLLCTGRLTFSIFPPIHVARARKELQSWRESPETAPSCRRLFNYLTASQVLTAAAPVLSLGGGIMMIAASTSPQVYSHEYDVEMSSKTPALKTIGWICVGAGLASSVAAAIMIGQSNKELSRTMGTMKLTAGPSGVGLVYSLPVHPSNHR